MLEKNKIKLAVLPGDGIGQEIMEAVLPVFSRLDLPVVYTVGEIGWSCWTQYGNPIPDKTWALIKQSDTSLLGAITSMPEKEAQQAIIKNKQLKDAVYVSPILQLRQQLDLYANVRPCFSVRKDKLFNLCIIRENTEGLYSGLDYEDLPQAFKPIVSQHPQWQNKMQDKISCTLRMQSRSALQRIFEFAFHYAAENNFVKVTYAGKPNVLRKSSLLGRSLFEEIAADYPNIQAEILNVDAVGMYLVKKPESLGVIVTENMFGDILADVAAGVMGGLGLAPSANIGVKNCYFEPVHGSGLRMPKQTANPSAMFFSVSMMLAYFGCHELSQKIKTAVLNILLQNQHVTPDIGGQATTREMADAIIQEAERLIVNK